MNALLHWSLIFPTVFLVVRTMPTPETTPPKLDSAYHQCKPLTNHTCARHFHMRKGDEWYARFPNTRGLSLDRALEEFSDFMWLLEQNNYCSRMLHTLLCLHYFPPCSPLNGPELIAQPCQEVCREATDACLPIARAIRGELVNIPHHLDCENFKPASHRSGNVQYEHRVENEVAFPTDPTVIVACSNSSIHVDFSPPPGQLNYEVIEGAGDLEVCLVLANVGSYDINASLETPVSVHITTTQSHINLTMDEPATPAVDYTPLSVTLTFPVGSNKWDSVCANVPIIDNGMINPDKSFGLEATILSPNTAATFGGSDQSLTGTIDAIIVDDDGILIGFQFPEGETAYESFEDDGYVEVCLVLVSDYEAVLATTVSVTLTPIQSVSIIFVKAEPELDYSLNFVTVEFPAGSEVGHVQCANISISADGLVEADESFSISATMSSSDTVRFVSEYHQSAIVNAIIRDDDECVIPVGQCRRNCDTRNNASRGIFRHNCYTYAAHVQVIGQRNLQGCSALDVTVLECWELQSGVCVSNDTRLSIPTCQNCEINVISGEDYLIAGLYQMDVGMFLPNYKKGGLIGEWYDRKYSSMSEWVQIGIDYKTMNTDSDCDE